MYKSAWKESAAELLIGNLPLENMPPITYPVRRACRAQSHGGKVRHTKLLPVRRNSCQDLQTPWGLYHIYICMLLIQRDVVCRYICL